VLPRRKTAAEFVEDALKLEAAAQTASHPVTRAALEEMAARCREIAKNIEFVDHLEAARSWSATARPAPR
jgi:hypothetical protein